MSDTENEEILKQIQSASWIEAIEHYWLAGLSKDIPRDVLATIVDLVNACKGLIDAGIGLQEISLKLYNDRIQDEDPIHRIAEDEFSGYFSKEQSLLLEKAVKNDIFKYFTDPISSLVEE